MCNSRPQIQGTSLFLFFLIISLIDRFGPPKQYLESKIGQCDQYEGLFDTLGEVYFETENNYFSSFARETESNS